MIDHPWLLPALLLLAPWLLGVIDLSSTPKVPERARRP